MEVAGWVQKIIREENPARVNIDAGGLGVGVYETTSNRNRTRGFEGGQGVILARLKGCARKSIDGGGNRAAPKGTRGCRFPSRQAEPSWSLSLLRAHARPLRVGDESLMSTTECERFGAALDYETCIMLPSLLPKPKTTLK